MKRYLIIIVVLSLVALWPFFQKGYFESHDGEWMVIRFTAFHQALVSGQFPVRYVERLNNNWGYPVLNFLYPLPFYLAELPKLAGFSFVASIKIVTVTSTIASVAAMYWALSQIATKNAALAGALIYLFVPYRFVDLYVRGNLGENLAFAVVPIVAGSIFKISQGKLIYVPILSAATGLLILSHNVIAVLFLPFFFVMAMILLKNIKSVVGAFVLGILIAAFFALPALYDLQFVKLSQIKVSEITNHLVGPTKLFLPSWGFGPNPNSAGGMSPQLGIVTIAVSLSALYLAAKTKFKNNLVTYFLLITSIVIFTSTKWSSSLWQNLPGADIIQFPWRMLSIITFMAAFLAAYLIDSAKSKALLATLVIAAAVISTIAYTRPAAFIDRDDTYYSTNEDTTNVRDEYLPLWVKDRPGGRAGEKLEILGNGQIISKSIGHLKYEAKIESPEDTVVQVNTIYFPSFTAKVDGKSTPITTNSSGLINFQLPSASHEVIINYTRSPVHLAAELISAVAILVTGMIFYRLWPKQQNSL